jgi:hypothetical protein
MSTQSPFSESLPSPSPSSKNKTTIIVVIVAVLGGIMLLCGGVFVALLIPAVDAARQAARQVQSQHQLKMIGLALHQYHDAYGGLPSVYSVDGQGRPLLSWRVAILPYLEENALHQKIDLDEPWDSPANAAASQSMPSFYLSPTYGSEGSNQTHYLAVQSPQSLFPDDQAVRLEDVNVSLSDLVAVVELPNKSLPWMKPDDTDPAEFFAAFAGAGPNGITVLRGDGSVTQLPLTTSELDVGYLVARDGAAP